MALLVIAGLIAVVVTEKPYRVDFANAPLALNGIFFPVTVLLQAFASLSLALMVSPHPYPKVKMVFHQLAKIIPMAAAKNHRPKHVPKADQK